MQGDRKKCISAGMDDYIAKPVELIHLEQMLKQWLPEKDHLTTSKFKNNEDIIFDQLAFKSQLLGKDKLMVKIARAFINDTELKMKQLSASIETRDLSKITALAHPMKGAAATVGGMAFSSQAHRIEIAGSEGELKQMAQLDSELKENFAQLKSALEESVL
ncbi:MAG: hypothetical protein HOM14_05515 [Gammaproteobacteria bacterium]|jgi:HPt (histidine-containing phosphotransfer) domain-containing protein|nr:hypothetical protein [Gammaproteobacteria bacterium]MBT3722281.1 hypothetical protein [Gammaproteobacteria bacterium]MBT4078123.1 hypothetical protein [Gammaproteobacteria bacterium]MBT4449581.1 hypothetical protein [Gammaproteobacteria bacterium]MBT4861818.1 hypothetical protein [Gammaproteobacteria bacterium]